MKLFIVRNYTKRYPHLKGKELTDQLILDLAVVYGLPKDRIGIDRTEKGKPYLKIIPDAAGAQEALPFISVSHCADTFACAFDDELIALLLRFKWWDKSIEEIDCLIPILTCSDLGKVREQIEARL